VYSALLVSQLFVTWQWHEIMLKLPLSLSQF